MDSHWKYYFLGGTSNFNISILTLAGILCVFPMHVVQGSVGDLGKDYTRNLYLLFYESLLSRIFPSLSSGCRYELPVIFQTGKIVFYRSFSSLTQCWLQPNLRLQAVKKKKKRSSSHFSPYFPRLTPSQDLLIFFSLSRTFR